MKARGRGTVAVHGRSSATVKEMTGRPLSEPLIRATTFALPSVEAHADLYRSRKDGFYQRFGHPTVSAAAKRLADFEGADAALMFGSGMGAISTTLMTFLRGGDHALVHREIFAQTRAALTHLERAFGVTVTEVDARDPSAVRRAVSPATRLIYIETPSNPLLHVVDIAAMAEVAREAGCILAVDSTFASPALQSPLALGATLSLHSGTKYIGGHSDVMCGFVAGDTASVGAIRDMQVLLGTVADPTAAWLVLRSAPTLPLRVQRSSESALALAKFLQSHEQIESVQYPWLESHAEYEVARRQMSGGGGVLSFTPRGGVGVARRVLNALRLIPIATSLGGVESVIELPYDLDFRDGEIAENRERSPALIRLSVGLEDVGDLIADIDQALAAQ